MVNDLSLTRSARAQIGVRKPIETRLWLAKFDQFVGRICPVWNLVHVVSHGSGNIQKRYVFLETKLGQIKRTEIWDEFSHLKFHFWSKHLI